jgi:hypothetical protein
VRIESVRELKGELMGGLQHGAVAESFAVLGGIADSADRTAARPKRTPMPRGIVLGVSPGRANKKEGHKLAVRFQERSDAAVRFGHYIVGKAHGEVDMQFIGEVLAGATADRGAQYQKSNRPLRNGYSIGHYQVSAGTLGCFVRSKAGQIGVLSNNHVLGNINRAKKGDAILQQAAADGGVVPRSVVGSFARLVKLLPKGNKVDAAWAVIEPKYLDAKLYADYAGKSRTGLVKSDDIVKSDKVWKVGRTTGLTRGTITAIELDGVAVGYPDFGTASFDGQIEVTGATGPFSLPGDSGSLILDEKNRALALLFGGSTQGGPGGSGRTFASPLETVLQLLGLALA